jgi:DNA-binding NtrC family response regulator
MVSYRIHVIDDDVSIRDGLVTALEDAYRVEAFPTAEEALEALEKETPDLILLDIGLPGMNGVEALRRIRDSHPEILVIMISAYEDIETVISCMKLGAHDYTVKPIHMDALEVTIRNALQTIALKREVLTLQKDSLEQHFPFITAESKQITHLLELVQKVARSPDTPVMILGETGTGKELIARAIHYHSPQSSGPMVTVNCAAIPRDLIESELFGHEQGAFTGARQQGKKGLIEEAAGGTLFLDEVGDLSPEAQGKLLRFFEDGGYYRVGGTKALRVQTRVVSATNKDIMKMIAGGSFREDLFYRLGVIKLEVPSLNMHPEDIIPIAMRFLVEYSQKFGKRFTGISPEAESALKGFRWQGNVRELRNVIERGVLIGTGPELGLQDVGVVCEPEKDERERDKTLFPPFSAEGADLTSVLESVEKHYIAEALKMAGGNESKAAQLLGLNHHTFRYRKKKLQVR